LIEIANRDMNEPHQQDQRDKPFFPSGAIFFFVLLLVFYALLWLVIYALMIVRS
jgi:hypothetical protein